MSKEFHELFKRMVQEQTRFKQEIKEFCHTATREEADELINYTCNYLAKELDRNIGLLTAFYEDEGDHEKSCVLNAISELALTIRIMLDNIDKVKQ